MPKIYDDEKLREEALRLRAEGLSYRQIAKKLGCSTYKVSEWLSGYEKERKKKMGEMTAELAKLEKRVQKFIKDIATIESKLHRLEDRLSTIEHIDVVEDMKDLSARVDELDTKMEIVEYYIDMLDIVGKEKLKRCGTKDRGLRWCSMWEWHTTPKNRLIYEASERIGDRYILVPERLPALCALCPFYKPRIKP